MRDLSVPKNNVVLMSLKIAVTKALITYLWHNKRNITITLKLFVRIIQTYLKKPYTT